MQLKCWSGWWSCQRQRKVWASMLWGVKSRTPPSTSQGSFQVPTKIQKYQKYGRSRYWILKGQWRNTQLILELMRAFLSGTFTFYLLLLSPNSTFFHFYFLLLLLSPSFILFYFDFFHISEFLMIRLNHVQVEWQTGMEVSSAGISCSVSTGWICKKNTKSTKVQCRC